MEKTIRLPAKYIERHQLPGQLKVQISNQTTSALLYPLNESGLAQLSPRLAETLSVPADIKWQYRWSPSSATLKLGPVIAIFCRRSIKTDSTSGTAGEINYLGKSSTELPGLFYVLRPDEVNNSIKVWEGLRYHDGNWVTGSFPWPQAVYDQIYSRRSERRDEVVNAKQVLHKITDNRYFNPRYFNKWEINQALHRTSIQRIIPDTRLVASLEQVQGMVSRYGAVYLKPTNGTLGMGIMRLARTGSGYRLSNSQGVSLDFASFRKAYDKARSQMTSKGYLVQQEIKLMRMSGHPVDVRVLIQKDGSGQFKITKVFARVAPGHQIVTNLATGGTALPLGKVIHAATNKNPQPILKKIRESATQIAAALEKTSGHIYGELGIDLGIDQSGRVWLIEVNSKPRRAVETEGNPELVRLSYLRPLQYASFLAGYYEVTNHD